jgi:hypothetical protein
VRGQLPVPQRDERELTAPCTRRLTTGLWPISPFGENSDLRELTSRDNDESRAVPHDGSDGEPRDLLRREDPLHSSMTVPAAKSATSSHGL